MKYKFGFIGTGNMGGALAKAVCKVVAPQEVILTDAFIAKAEELASELGAVCGTGEETVKNSDFIFIGVKPQMLETLGAEIGDMLSSRAQPPVLISMAAGTSVEKIEKIFGDFPVIRIMPNVAAAVGEAMILCCRNEKVTEEQYADFTEAMAMSGRTDEIPEKLIDAASAVSGCGPAYVYMMIEALADGAVACGVPRDKAYLYAAQTLSGSAKLMLETGKNPGALKDSVCSPGGTTIQGVRKLEDGGFRGTVMEAVIAAYEKNFNLK